MARLRDPFLFAEAKPPFALAETAFCDPGAGYQGTVADFRYVMKAVIKVMRISGVDLAKMCRYFLFYLENHSEIPRYYEAPESHPQIHENAAQFTVFERFSDLATLFVTPPREVLVRDEVAVQTDLFDWEIASDEVQKRALIDTLIAETNLYSTAGLSVLG